MDAISWPAPADGAAKLREFEAVMRQYNRRLFRTARSILRNDADAEEAVQEAYLRAFTHLAEHAGTASLGTWLTRILINEALGRLRRQRTVESLDELAETAALEATMMDSPEHLEPEQSPEDLAAGTEMRRLIEQAIDKLPPTFRVVFMLRAVEQMSTDETAQVLGIPPETVRSRFHRGKQQLRSSLSRHFSSALPDAFAFDGERCDRVVAAVLARIQSIHRTKE